MVVQARQQGIRTTARAWRCSRNALRKWLRRLERAGKPGLREHSQAPKRIPHRTSPEVEQ